MCYFQLLSFGEIYYAAIENCYNASGLLTLRPLFFVQLAAFIVFDYIFSITLSRIINKHCQDTVLGNVQDTKGRVAESLSSQNFASVIELSVIMAILVGYKKISGKTKKDQGK